MQSPKQGVHWWRVLAIAAGVVTVGALGLGVWHLLCGKQIEAANWVMAAGGMGILIFSTVQLHRDAQREVDRLTGARAKLKPVAWLARRMCEQAVIESDGKSMKEWLVRWYTPVRLYLMEGGGGPNPLSVLEDRMRETVTLAAEASSDDVQAADAAFDAFIAAANILNDLIARNVGGAEITVYQATIPKAREAAQHLARAAVALEALAKRGTDEPAVPVNPQFRDER